MRAIDLRQTPLLGVAAAAILLVAGCASGTDVGSAPPAPVPTGAEAQALLSELPTPSATEPVLALATVLETDGGAILCVGAVAESAPPQCSGPELIGWDWNAYEHQETGGVRWVQGVALEGTFDGDAATFTQTGQPTSAATISLPAIEMPEGELDEATAEAVQADFFAVERADVLAVDGGQGTVVVQVVYDDGSVQAAVDEIYGPDVVFVISALRAGAPAMIDEPTDSAGPGLTGEEAQARLAELPTPSATAPVLAIGMVLEASTGAGAGIPMLCYNVAASLPPQCGGPEVASWDWSSIEHEEASGVRWSDSVAMRVTYDAATRTVTPVEMLDLAALTLPQRETPTGSLDATTVQSVQDAIFALQRPDVLGGGGGDGIVLLEVVYDDGSIQDALDVIYGPGAVHVWSWLA